MKIRRSFICNSSSSSFLCSICSTRHEGMDLTPYDVGGFTCENEHQICDCTDKLKVTIEQKRNWLIEKFNEYIEYFKSNDYYNSKPQYLNDAITSLKELENNIGNSDIIEDMYETETESGDGVAYIECPVCNFLDFDEAEMASYLLASRKYSREEVFKGIKELNKRRKKLYNSEYIHYVLSQIKMTSTQIEDEIKDKFSSFKEFSKYLRENNG